MVLLIRNEEGGSCHAGIGLIWGHSYDLVRDSLVSSDWMGLNLCSDFLLEEVVESSRRQGTSRGTTFLAMVVSLDDSESMSSIGQGFSHWRGGAVA